MTDHLARLDEILSSMASSSTPEDALNRGSLSSPSTSQTLESSSSTWGQSSSELDVLDCSIAHNARTVTSPGCGATLFPSAAIFGSPLAEDVALSSKQRSISAQLYAYLPPECTSTLLVSNGPSMFLGPHGPGSHDYQVRPTDHPVLIAKRLMMLALCLQQLPSSFDMDTLVFHGNVDSGTLVRTWVDAVSSMVTSDDGAVANVHGVETLILQAIVQGDSGQLRKAWVTGRKAISMAMLLGLHSDSPSKAISVSSCIPGEIVSPQTIDSLWFRANCIDRYASLVLGLPPTSMDTSFATEARMRDDGPEDRLGKVYAVCAGRICERNQRIASGQDARDLTRSIEVELESVAHLVDNAWWHPPPLRMAGSGLSGELMVMNLQVRHYVLTVLLQLPYMLQEEQLQEDAGSREHSRLTCMHACRAVIHRFLRFRSVYKSVATGRQIDYAALLSSMTLLQGHIVRQQLASSGSAGEASLRSADVALVDSARQIMQEIAACNRGDALSSEAAESLQDLLIYLQEPSGCAIAPGTDTVDAELWDDVLFDTVGPQEQLLTGLDPAPVFPVESF